MKITILHLPGGRWCLAMPDLQVRSDPAPYNQRIVWSYSDDYTYVGQTAYYGEPAVWKISKQIPHAEVDHSTRE